MKIPFVGLFFKTEQQRARADIIRIKRAMRDEEDKTRMGFASGLTLNTAKGRILAWAEHRERVKPLRTELTAAINLLRRMRGKPRTGRYTGARNVERPLWPM